MEYFLDENAPSRTLVVTNTNFLLGVLTYQILTNRALPSRICSWQRYVFNGVNDWAHRRYIDLKQKSTFRQCSNFSDKEKSSYNAKFDFQYYRRKKKESFGKIIQNYLKTSLGRSFKFLRRINRQIFDEEKPLVTQNTPYVTSTEKLKFSNIYHVAWLA